MLSRSPKLTTKQRKQQRRINVARYVKELRDREKKKLGQATVTYDAAILDMLVLRKYLTDEQTTDKKLVGKALSQFLWDGTR